MITRCFQVCIGYNEAIGGDTKDFAGNIQMFVGDVKVLGGYVEGFLGDTKQF